ncbi:unnamed protein product [Pieris brassicae]|uniref:Uncharacterized protein n=1 Tax=Pieris brassicae TaxID=7116 RepID=A0A9P0X9K0_PIEBR|nr:unnamed protein product [Pieris brassicae]
MKLYHSFFRRRLHVNCNKSDIRASIHDVACLADRNPEFLAPKIAGRAADWSVGRATLSACRSAVLTARRSVTGVFFPGP